MADRLGLPYALANNLFLRNEAKTNEGFYIMNLFMDWGIGTSFGWGLLGLNLFSRLAARGNCTPIMGAEIDGMSLNGIDPLTFIELLPAIQRSNLMLNVINDTQCVPDGMVMYATGNGFVLPEQVRKASLSIGRVVFENTLSLNLPGNLDMYDVLLTASEWNASMLRSCTAKNVKVIHEGVDTSLFSCGTKSGMLPGNRFYIYSGGKVEYRKGQDLVLEVFRRFSQDHDDAYLVVPWQSPWPKFGLGLQGVLSHPLGPRPDGMLDIKKWCHDNGINPDKVIALDPIPNQMMPHIYREMDVAIQLSRAEACTNLPLKEAMACGVPCIASLNTGVADLLSDENSIPIRTQKPVQGMERWGTEGWGEADLDEALHALESVYQDRAMASRIGRQGAQWIVEQQRTWNDHVELLESWLTTLLP